jgi:hypothetical protein
MAKEKFSISIAKKIVILLKGGSVPSSSFPSWLVNELLNEDLITSISHKSRVSYRAIDICKLANYIKDKYTGGAEVERWVELKSYRKEDIDRSVLVKETSNSKLLKVNSFKGFLVNSCEPIDSVINNKHFTISPTEGTAIFIQYPDSFSIPPDVLIVGVENGENFKLIRRQRHLFDNEKVLFVSRYPYSLELRKWLVRIPNNYIHFGDFDLAGISIFQNEFFKYIGNRAQFFIPADIEERISKGNKRLYDAQYAKYKNMEIKDPRVNKIVKLIHKYCKVYEQEGYI